MPNLPKTALRHATLLLISSALPLSWGSFSLADDKANAKVIIRLSLAPSSKDAAPAQASSEPTAPQTALPQTTPDTTLELATDASQTWAGTAIAGEETTGRKPGIPILWTASPIFVSPCAFDEDADELTELTLDGVESVSPIAQPAMQAKNQPKNNTTADPKKDSAITPSAPATDGLLTLDATTAELLPESEWLEAAGREQTDQPPTKLSSRPAKSLAENNSPAELPRGQRLQELDDLDELELSPATDQDVAVEGTEECPGSPEADLATQTPQLDDLPLEQEEHPYDAPAAKSSKDGGSRRTVTALTTEDERLRDRINTILLHFLTHPENVSKRGPWALMHAALPFGVESEVIAGNRSVNTLGWMCYNGVSAKQRMFQPTKQGFRTNVGPGVQGHEGQFLAILAQSSVQADYPIMIGNRRYTIMDLAKYEMATCREKTELTFKLIGLSHYLEADQQWRDNRGRVWSLEKMVAEELAQPVIGQACGGTHRLMGLSYSLIKRQQAGRPITGHWKRSEVFLNDFVNYAMSLQNADGSFSTEWFEGRGDAPDIERKIQTTGHILEWLVYTLPDEHLRSPRIQKSIEFVVNSLGKELDRDWPIGPRGHALRAIALYNQRVFGAEAGKMRAFVATSTNPAVIKR